MLKQKQKSVPIPDIQSLYDNLVLFLTDETCAEATGADFKNTLSEVRTADSIDSLTTDTLSAVRDLLFKMEMALRHDLA